MTLKNHPFFKKYKNLKIGLLLHLFFSLLIFISGLVRGYINNAPLLGLKKPYENYTALSNPEKYLKSDFFVVDTAFIGITWSGKSSDTKSEYTVIKGNLLHSKVKKEIICQDDNLATFYSERLALVNDNLTYVYNRKAKPVKVWRNTLNDDLFLANKKHLSEEKINAICDLYIQFSLLLITAILLLLKEKSEVRMPQVKKVKLI